LGTHNPIFVFIDQLLPLQPGLSGSGLKRHNWLLTKRKHVDRCKCYVSPNG
jgi:hypothetical protein